jgi:tetratricopeptide (TPR) repeat protein
MKKSCLFILLFVFSAYCFSQTIHSTGEILKIMTDSKLSYEIKILDSTINCKDYSDKLNYHDCYRNSTDSGLYTYKFSSNDQSKPIFDKAETFFQSNQLDSALVYYKSSLQADSSLFNVMTYIGQIYGSKGDYRNAIEWYKKAIHHNYIDYMAHWFLADAYLATQVPDKALNEIAIAQILNRNNQRIKKSFIKILEKNKRSTEDWCFNPQMELSKISDNKISVSLKDNWTGYAMAKALWTYEPGYRESMGVATGQYSTLEDKECLISLLMGIENAKIKIKDDPQLKILKDAAERKYLDEYILYEIVLPQAPFVAYQLPEQTIQQIKDYIINVRNTKN